MGILAGILTIALAVAAAFFYHRRKSAKSANGVAFENPSYLREVNMDHVQVSGFFLMLIGCCFFNQNFSVIKTRRKN